MHNMLVRLNYWYSDSGAEKLCRASRNIGKFWERTRVSSQYWWI